MFYFASVCVLVGYYLYGDTKEQTNVYLRSIFSRLLAFVCLRLSLFAFRLRPFVSVCVTIWVVLKCKRTQN